MVDSRRPALQLFDQLFGEEQQTRNIGLENLKAYLENGGSIFPLVEKGVQGLVRERRVSPNEAQCFLRGANSMATYLRRQFIEQTLTGDKTAATRSTGGLLSMVDGPNYGWLIGTDFSKLCPPDALESIASPVAYLIALLGWIRDRIQPEGDQEEKYHLHERRKDLLPLSVDFNAVYQSISSVDIIVSVLETFIAANTESGTDPSIEDALIKARYPNGLPYYQHWVTIDGIAQRHNLSVGDFEHRVDLAYPYFLQGNARGPNTGRGFAHASRLSPYQRQLLTQDRPDHDDREDFYADNFGTDNLDKYANLNQVVFLGERTKLTSAQIEALLSIRDFAPVRSANVDYPDLPHDEPESARSGSVYINDNTSPGVRIDDESIIRHRLTANPDDKTGFNRYDRINQMVRLGNWTGLPFDQVDAVLVAAIRATARGYKLPVVQEMNISSGVVQALGLFQTLRERHECTAADFALFIDGLSVYGRGGALSQFDQIFNDQTGYREPLKLDNGAFALAPGPGQVDLTISQLCSALAIDLQTYYYLAMTVAKAHGLTDTLYRSPAIISAFCRLVKLPRLLNITPVEGVLMLSLLGGDAWVNGLAGLPYIYTEAYDAPDVLELIEAMHSCVQWCTQSNLSVLWVLQHSVEAQSAQELTEQDSQFFEQIGNLLPTDLLSNSAFQVAGVPSPTSAAWLEFLSASAEKLDPVVDSAGLVLPFAGTAAEHSAALRAKVIWAVDSGLGAVDAAWRLKIIETMTNVLVRFREAQASLVKETLAVYAGVGVEEAIPTLHWANATVYQLLQHVLELTATNTEEPDRTRNRNTGPVLRLLAEVRRRSEVVSTLGLNATLLQDYLDYGHRAWFDQADRHTLSVHTLYYLTTLTRAFSLGVQPAQKLLDYLRQVNELPDVTGDARSLVEQAAELKLADFFAWSVQEVRECISRVVPSGLKVLKNLSQLDLLMRVRVLSAETGMDVLTIFLIGSLPETVDKHAYAAAAEHALLSELGSQGAMVHVPTDLGTLVKTRCDIVGSNYVVANKPGEKVTYKVTLESADGRALSGINVYWRAALGTIETGATGEYGTLEVTYTPGPIMGQDTPMFWLALFEPELAPPVVIGTEFSSLYFPIAELSPTPSGDVPKGQEVELYAVLEDAFGNRATDSLVEWFAESKSPSKLAVATIRPRQGFTDQQGLTRVFVSSATGGTFVLSVRTQSGESERQFIDPITFASK